MFTLIIATPLIVLVIFVLLFAFSSARLAALTDEASERQYARLVAVSHEKRGPVGVALRAADNAARKSQKVVACIAEGNIRDAQIYHGKNSDRPWDSEEWQDASVAAFIGVYDLRDYTGKRELIEKLCDKENIHTDSIILIDVATGTPL